MRGGWCAPAQWSVAINTGASTSSSLSRVGKTYHHPETVFVGMNLIKRECMFGLALAHFVRQGPISSVRIFRMTSLNVKGSHWDSCVVANF